jgi:hypothetical protein
MSLSAPLRGALLGQAYLPELEAIDHIRDLRDGVKILDELLGETRGGYRTGQIVRSRHAILRTVRELENALGSSADE